MFDISTNDRNRLPVVHGARFAPLSRRSPVFPVSGVSDCEGRVILTPDYYEVEGLPSHTEFGQIIAWHDQHNAALIRSLANGRRVVPFGDTASFYISI